MKRMAVAAGVVWGVAVSGYGAGFGLPVGDTAYPVEQEFRRGSAYVAAGSDLSTYGARLSRGLVEGLTVFGDLGIVDVDDVDYGPGVQLGAVGAVPIELPVDVAGRGTVNVCTFDEGDMFGGTLALLVSRQLSALPEFSLYVGAGAAYTEFDSDGVKEDGTPIGPDGKTEALVSGGALCDFDENWSAFAEFDYVEDPFYAGGLQFRW